jgi:hypothetical protein
MPPALFALAIFQTGSCLFAQAGLDCDYLIYVFLIAGMMPLCPAFFFFLLSWDLANIFARADLKLQSPISVSQVARIIGVRHHASLFLVLEIRAN